MPFFLGLLIELVSDKGGDDHLAEILSLGPNTRLGRNTRILGLWPILRQAERPKEAQHSSIRLSSIKLRHKVSVIGRKVARFPQKACVMGNCSLEGHSQ